VCADLYEILDALKGGAVNGRLVARVVTC